MALFIILTIITLIVFFAKSTSKTKQGTSAVLIHGRAGKEGKPPTQEGLTFARDHFGSEWKNYLRAGKIAVRQNDAFFTTVAMSHDLLSPAEKRTLLLSFLNVKVSSNSDNGPGLNVNVSLTDYSALHAGTLALLKQQKFTKEEVRKLFLALIRQQERRREEYMEKEVPDQSVIDVTGQSYRIPYSPEEPSLQNTPTNPPVSAAYGSDEYYEIRLGDKYREKLNLSKQEAAWLNKFWNPHNVFLSIEGCCTETIRLYLAVLQELAKQLKKKGTTLNKEATFLKEEAAKGYTADSSAYWNGYNEQYHHERTESDVYLTIFKRVENTVREVFGHKRKLSETFPSTNATLVEEFESRLGGTVNVIIQALAPTIGTPDDATELALNAQNVTRWKTHFEQLSAQFTPEHTPAFLKGVFDLEKANAKNPSVENLFFEASKFLARYNKPEALKLYTYYLYYDLKSEKVDNKQLTKTVQKALFTNTEQLRAFEEVVAELVNDRNLDHALQRVAALYLPKRKKVQLDENLIQEVQQQHTGTVELLSEYLKDEHEFEGADGKTEEPTDEEITIEIPAKTGTPGLVSSTGGTALTPAQAEAINLFVHHQFVVRTIDLEAFAKDKGVFKNQLIDSINESFYELLDDVLIEEEAAHYSMNQEYYQKIASL
jgi:hypothetical protein